MPIFRGSGGSGEASTNAYASEIAVSAATATEKANEAAASAAAAAASEATVAASAAAASVSADSASTAQTAAELAQTNAEAAETAALAAQTGAEAAETLAEKWATELEDVVVADSKYSAFHWAQKAEEFAASADLSTGTPNTLYGYDALGNAEEILKSAFATSAQGSLADTSLQPNTSITVTGLHVDATSAIELPTGTEAQRPAGTAGMLRFNTDAASFEGYDGTAWGEIAGGGGGGIFSIFGERNTVVTPGDFVAYGNGANRSNTGVEIYRDCTFDGLSFKSNTAVTSDCEIELYLNGVASGGKLTILNGTDSAFVTGLDIAITAGDSIHIGVNSGSGGGAYTATAWFLTPGVVGPTGPIGPEGPAGSIPLTAGVAVSTGLDWATSLAVPTGDLVGTTAVQTLTNKTFTGYTETVFALTGTTPAIDVSNGTIQTWTLTGASTPTDSLSSGNSVLLLIDDGTANTITWTMVDVWTTGGGTAPTLRTTGYTHVLLWKVSTTVYGALIGDPA